MTAQLPSFPVDDQTLDLLEAALDPRSHGDTDAKTSGVWPLLEFMSQMAGSDTRAVEEILDDGSDGGASIVMMRDPQYHDNDVIAALVAEVRRLRVSSGTEHGVHGPGGYRSTACLHAVEPGREALHDVCQTDAMRYDGSHKTPAQCKYGDGKEPCTCPCHTKGTDRA